MHFICHDTTQSLLPMVFQIVLRGRGMGNLPGGIFLSGGENLKRSDFGHSNLFQG